MSQAELHPSIVALVALAANIAANHPNRGMCQIDKLRHYGVPDHHIDTAIEIARHIRDEAGQKNDAAFDEARAAQSANALLAAIPIAGACCTPTPGGKSCC
jgi:hypothetical protein